MTVLWQLAQSFGQQLMDMVSPPVCPLCRKAAFLAEDRLCQTCEDALPLLPEKLCRCCGGPNDGFLDICNDCLKAEGGRPWSLAVTAFPFAGNARTAIHCYKYRRRTSLAPFLSRRMVQAWQQSGGGFMPDVITYIPLYFLRFLQRGYNQSQILAQMIGKQLDIPCRTLLRRQRRTHQQASLSREQRIANMNNAFAPCNIEQTEGQNILLVDDVFTTGTTLTAAAKALRKAGAADIAVITIARD